MKTLRELDHIERYSNNKEEIKKVKDKLIKLHTKWEKTQNAKNN